MVSTRPHSTPPSGHQAHPVSLPALPLKSHPRHPPGRASEPATKPRPRNHKATLRPLRPSTAISSTQQCTRCAPSACWPPPVTPRAALHRSRPSHPQPGGKPGPQFPTIPPGPASAKPPTHARGLTQGDPSLQTQPCPSRRHPRRVPLLKTARYQCMSCVV